MIKKEVSTNSPEETIKLAQKIGAKLKGGECIELVSDVGGGKTTFVRGLAQGAGSSSHVSSPTFTISKIYETPNFKIAHFDFYRLQDPELIKHELAEYIEDDSAVVIIEWSNIIQDILPEDRIKITFKNSGENKRQIEFNIPKKLNCKS